MHRIDTPTAEADLHGTGKAGFRAGAPPGTASTRLDEDWFNAIQEEPANAIEGFGDTLVKGNNTQLLALLKRQAVKAALCSLRIADDTGAGVTLEGLARKASTGQVVVVGPAAAIASGGRGADFAAETAGSSYAGDFYDIAYDATLGLYIAVGETGEIQTSTGNGTWTRRATGGADLFGVATNGLGVCVAVGTSDVLKWSTNGTTWNAAVNPFPAATGFELVVFGAGLFVAANGEGSIISSADGETWTTRRAFAGAGSSGRLAYDASLGFLYHYDQDIFRSPDGITWTKIHDLVGANIISLIAAPYTWAITFSTAAGTVVDGRYSVTAVDHATDFTIDYVANEAITWLKFIDGQLWGLSGDKIYVGGVL